MKKFLSLLLASLLCFSLSACGAPKTVEDALKKADAIVEKWDKDTHYGCGFESDYSSESNKYYVTSYLLTAADETISAKFVTAELCSEFIYEGLSEILSDFGVSIVTVMIDENEDIYYVTVDGEEVDWS